MDVPKYRSTVSEQERTADLMRLLPEGRHSVLEIGARDGHFSQLLASRFEEVVALDLDRPDFEISGVTPVKGDVTALEFEDNRFDCIVCTEVLEHVEKLREAADEISRVARHEVLIGVPYRQDTRLGRTTCRTCGSSNPPWGHVNQFDQPKLSALFDSLKPMTVSLVSENRAGTNALSTWLLDKGGNPWGTYDQDEPCIHCGSRIVQPFRRSGLQRTSSAVGHLLQKLQSPWIRPHANWIHMLFQKL
jgi:ubiquinone/menaquinone biosynthesis C-methylase UbiE